MKYTRAQRAEHRQPETITPTTPPEDDNNTEPIFFWREFEQPYGIFCQWYTSYFQDTQIHPSHTFNCAEQYMMYRKALILATEDGESGQPNSEKEKLLEATGGKNSKVGSRRDVVKQAQKDRSRLPNMILAEQKPGRQKELARSVRFTDAQLEEWERIKFDVVVRGSYLKYCQNAELRARLLATGNRELVEASPQDAVWGIGHSAEFAVMHRQHWGSNLLGKALMSVRESLRVEDGEQGSAEAHNQDASITR